MAAHCAVACQVVATPSHVLLLVVPVWTRGLRASAHRLVVVLIVCHVDVLLLLCSCEGGLLYAVEKLSLRCGADSDTLVADGDLGVVALSNVAASVSLTSIPTGLILLILRFRDHDPFHLGLLL